MAAGVPVVASVRDDNFVGFRLRSGQDLVLVPQRDPAALASAILELLDDPAYAQRVARGGRELIERSFTLDAVTDRHVDLYSRLAGTSAATASG
jgi:glycosyltransferase involved in cell wall biosynthesis